jgi:hypothetical protein
MKDLGYLLLVIGVAGAAYFLLFFDSSVLVAGTEGLRVSNLSLLGDRQNGMILSVGIAISGIILLAFSYSRTEHIAVPSPTLNPWEIQCWNCRATIRKDLTHCPKCKRDLKY